MRFRVFTYFAVLSASASAQSLAPKEATTAAAVASELDQAERVTKATESWELKGGSAFFEGQSQAPALQNTLARISNVLAAQPANIRALVLKARTLRALMLVTPTEIKLEDKGARIASGDTSTMRSDGLAALDRALKLDPNNADAYYWRARMLSLSDPAAEQAGAEPASDPSLAIVAARMAVTLAPSNASYREYLASTLIGTGHTSEGFGELRKLPGKHPILQLVDDLTALPIPPGAKANEERTAELIPEIFGGYLDKFPYAGMRAKVYTVPASTAMVRGYYGKIWPGIHWLKTEGSSHAAGFAWNQDKLEPVADAAPFAGDFDKALPPSGLLIVVGTQSIKPVRTTLFLVNFRRF